MWLNVVWYIIFVVTIAGYLILDGFDLGVGILHLFLARKDEERRIFINSIGPVWDGNEVWLVVGGGVLFAAFPLVYASLFSGFYVAMMLVLLFLILRAVAIEFRSKRHEPGWRSAWDIVFSLASLLLALLFGVAFGNVIGGISIDATGTINVSLLGLVTPFALLVAVTTIFMFATHAAIYLTMKTEGELLERIKRSVPRLMIAFFVLNTLVVAATFFFHDQVNQRYLNNLWLVVFPAAALAAVILSWFMVQKGRYFAAFLASSAMIALLILSAASGIYPNLLVSTLNPAYNLTVFNSASAPNTLQVMLVMAIIGMPFVILYTAGIYYIFRGKVKVSPGSY